MNEAKVSNNKSFTILGTAMATIITTLFSAVAAWCVLSMIEGLRSWHQHNTNASLQQIDSLLSINTWKSPPLCVTRMVELYLQQQSQFSTEHLLSKVTAIQKDLIGTQDHRFNKNPFSEKLLDSYLTFKNKIYPILMGSLAIVVLRMWVLVTALPLFTLSLGLGFIDGLVQRDIRKFQGARESALLFHRIKYSGSTFFFLPLFAYLIWLSPISPQWFFLPMSIILGFWINFTIRFFKKYV